MYNVAVIIFWNFPQKNGRFQHIIIATSIKRLNQTQFIFFTKQISEMHILLFSVKNLLFIEYLGYKNFSYIYGLSSIQLYPF